MSKVKIRFREQWFFLPELFKFMQEFDYTVYTIFFIVVFDIISMLIFENLLFYNCYVLFL